MNRTGSTFAEYLADYLARLSPLERSVFEEKRRLAAEENRRICKHRAWYTSNPPICAGCGRVGIVDDD